MNLVTTPLILLATAAALSGCDGYEPTASTQSIELVKVSGGGKDVTIVSETDRHDSLVVKVLDQAGRPVGGVRVSWSLAAPGSWIEPLAATTGADGKAAAQWTLAGLPGTHEASAQIDDRPPVTFTFRVRSWEAKHFASGGNGHQCAIAHDEVLSCSRSDGRLRPVLTDLRFRRLATTWAAGNPSNGMCGLTTQGRVWCADMRSATLTFTEVAGGYPPFREISASHWGTFCAISQDGELWCWGRPEFGMRADGVTIFGQYSPTPARATYSGQSPLISVALGYDIGCALTADGTPWCWGQNQYGVLDPADLATTNGNLPRAIDVGEPLTSVTPALGGSTICGLNAGRRAVCWGRTAFSGRSASSLSVAPGYVDSDLTFASISPVLTGYIGVTVAGDIVVWGAIFEGHSPLAATPIKAPAQITPSAGAISTSIADWYNVCVTTVGGRGTVCQQAGEVLWPDGTEESLALTWWKGLLPPVPVDSL